MRVGRLHLDPDRGVALARGVGVPAIAGKPEPRGRHRPGCRTRAGPRLHRAVDEDERDARAGQVAGLQADPAELAAHRGTAGADGGAGERQVGPLTHEHLTTEVGALHPGDATVQRERVAAAAVHRRRGAAEDELTVEDRAEPDADVTQVRVLDRDGGGRTQAEQPREGHLRIRTDHHLRPGDAGGRARGASEVDVDRVLVEPVELQVRDDRAVGSLRQLQCDGESPRRAVDEADVADPVAVDVTHDPERRGDGRQQLGERDLRPPLDRLLGHVEDDPLGAGGRVRLEDRFPQRGGPILGARLVGRAGHHDHRRLGGPHRADGQTTEDEDHGHRQGWERPCTGDSRASRGVGSLGGREHDVSTFRRAERCIRFVRKRTP